MATKKARKYLDFAQTGAKPKTKKLKTYRNVTEKILKKNTKYLVEKDSKSHDIRDLVKQVSDKKKQEKYEKLKKSLTSKSYKKMHDKKKSTKY